MIQVRDSINTVPLSPILEQFHPAVATWFHRKFPEGPTASQEQGWRQIRQGRDTLIVSPTGSGKTLSAFLQAIDALYQAHRDGMAEPVKTSVVYVSPLKALAVDIHQHLEQPLKEIAETAADLGQDPPRLTVGVRTGDTPASKRASMLKSPPTFLVTTPESLYLLLSSAGSRRNLTSVKTVIVDEIHALAKDKRGAHLALSLERLEHLQCGEHPQRIGLSATQKPVRALSLLLGGYQSSGCAREVAIVDTGMRRDLELSMELPATTLGAVSSSEQMDDLVKRLAVHIQAHKTTLVFVNTRRMAERLAHLLSELLGDQVIAAHHGSLSRPRRQHVEDALRSGQLRAVVATASLELGIDVGPVELVCQIGSPRNVATFLQRVGRSNHSRHGVPAGIVFPLTRDELVECAALLSAVRAGELDAVLTPVAPLDILAQQIVAEVSVEEWGENDLFKMVRCSAPYADLSSQQFESVLELTTEGIITGWGRKGAHIYRDRAAGTLRARRGARLASLTCGGAIPEVGEYRVLADPGEVQVGTVNEDFALESMVGDVFLLGTHSWRILHVGRGIVRVADASGAHPTVPFWLGEAPARTEELSRAVSQIRESISVMLSCMPAGSLGSRAGIDGLSSSLSTIFQLSTHSARQIVEYLVTAHEELGVIPTEHDIVFERFFDETGGMQLVIHSPMGARINRALGLALRKRFCTAFDFELQAAADDDTVLISLGLKHSFALSEVASYLRSASCREILSQAVLAAPMFRSRWRWNAGRALMVLRYRGGRRHPLAIQRMEADDLMAAVFPALAACQENTPPGPISIPDHPLVTQTLQDCLSEATDAEGLRALLERIESGQVRTHFVESCNPSVLAQGILNGRPFTFLDDAPLEERRSRAVQPHSTKTISVGDHRRIDPMTIEDPIAVAAVTEELMPSPRDPFELHDLLRSLVVTTPLPGQDRNFAFLVDTGRAFEIALARSAETFWGAQENMGAIEQIFYRRENPDGKPLSLPCNDMPGTDQVAIQAVRGHLETAGIVTVDDLISRTGLDKAAISTALGHLQVEGFALQLPSERASLTPAGSGQAIAASWCSRRFLFRLQAYRRSQRRPAPARLNVEDVMSFLLTWQHVTPGYQLSGREGLKEVICQLQGFELAAGAWESSVLPTRVAGFQSEWLDDLCRSGEVVWGRLKRPGRVHTNTAVEDPPLHRGASTPSPSTPLTFAMREDLSWLASVASQAGKECLRPVGPALAVLELLRSRGALFRSEIAASTKLLPGQLDEALWHLVSTGMVTADSFQAVRSLLSPKRSNHSRRRFTRSQRAHLSAYKPRAVIGSTVVAGEGRWALLAPVADEERWGGLERGQIQARAAGIEPLAEAAATQLLKRWGIVLKELTRKETMVIPWRDILLALRRFEARGIVLGGCFVEGVSGEQYALPEALEHMRSQSRSHDRGCPAIICASDPLNLTGFFLPGSRLPARSTSWLVYENGALHSSELTKWPSFSDSTRAPGFSAWA